MSSPLLRYRRLQRQIRAEFDRFTQRHCPSCETPCCRKPARITPTDILLASASGWKPHTPEAAEAVEHACSVASRRLSSEEEPVDFGSALEDGQPCDLLGDQGCTLPADLRPFGCTAYICPVMYREMDPKRLSRIKRHIRDLERTYLELLSAIAPK